MSENISLNGIVIGKVYKSSHGVWVAQPAWSNYSCSFSTYQAAVVELCVHYQNQQSGLVIH